VPTTATAFPPQRLCRFQIGVGVGIGIGIGIVLLVIPITMWGATELFLPAAQVSPEHRKNLSISIPIPTPTPMKKAPSVKS
jgi:hypothetical protein